MVDRLKKVVEDLQMISEEYHVLIQVANDPEHYFLQVQDEEGETGFDYSSQQNYSGWLAYPECKLAGEDKVNEWFEERKSK